MVPLTLLFCSAGFVLGTLAVTPLSLDLRVVVATGCAALGSYAVWGRESWRFRALLVAALVAGAFDASARGTAIPKPYELRTARYAATVLTRTAASDGSIATLLVLPSGIVADAHLRAPVPAPGRRVELRGRLASFDGPRNPGEPDLAAIEGARGIDARLESAVVLKRLAGRVRSPAIWLARAHEWAHATLRGYLGEPDASVLAGELWGERGALPPDLQAAFQSTGTVHVLVTAGLHLGAVAFLVVALLARCGWPRGLTCALATVAIWAFVWWSGGHLPAVRAATMATVALAARACGRATLSWNALGIAALVVAASAPREVASASFALSFSCVGAIFACAQPLARAIDGLPLPERAREAIVLTLATQLGTWPIGAAVFLQFAPYATLANVAVVPCVALTMALGAATLLAAAFAPLAQAFANLCTWPLGWTLGAVRLFGALPGATLHVTPAPAWCIAAYDVALLATPWLWRRGARTAVAVLLAGATLLVLEPPRAFDPRLRVTAIDVGQADGLLIQTPRGHAILVDAGGRLERGPQSAASTAEAVGTRTVVPFLLRLGVHSLDAIVLSHPHGDHAGGIAPVLRALRDGELADGGQTYPGHAYHDALDVARSEAVPIVTPRAGTVWHTDDGVTLEFLGPSLPFIGGRNAINDNSVAFMLRYRHFRMLFTGDAGAAAEERFLAEGIDLHADVLKVGHHGSAYSSTPAFIAAVRPRDAIISVGRHNLFGHPAPSTLATLRRFGARIYRTDRNGAIAIATDGATYSIRVQLPSPST